MLVTHWRHTNAYNYTHHAFTHRSNSRDEISTWQHYVSNFITHSEPESQCLQNACHRAPPHRPLISDPKHKMIHARVCAVLSQPHAICSTPHIQWYLVRGQQMHLLESLSNVQLHVHACQRAIRVIRSSLDPGILHLRVVLPRRVPSHKAFPTWREACQLAYASTRSASLQADSEMANAVHQVERVRWQRCVFCFLI